MLNLDIRHGDCLAVLKSMFTNSVDSIVTDPPYGLAFMNKHWDYDVPSVEVWRECLRVLKPGGHLLSFGGTRTYHRMVVNIEDAGFEIRDQLQWLTGQGFPKSLDVLKAARKEGLACECNEKPEYSMRSLSEENLSASEHTENKQGKVLQSCMSEQGLQKRRSKRTKSQPCNGEESSLEGGLLHRTSEGLSDDPESYAPESQTKRICTRAHNGSGKDARQTSNEERRGSSLESQSKRQPPREFKDLRKSQRALDGASLQRCSKCSKTIFPEGLGSALKPANEPICLARKPLSESTLAKNVKKWGTGGLNIDASRIEGKLEGDPNRFKRTDGGEFVAKFDNAPIVRSEGRWPANVLFDEEAAKMLDEQSGILKQGVAGKRSRPFGDGNIYGTAKEFKHNGTYACDTPSGASRFFYCAKASKSERNAGLEGMPVKLNDFQRESSGLASTTIDGVRQKGNCGQPNANHHPTVKPLKLMEYLCRLITPPNGTVLDPFMGSGTTGCAAKSLGFKFVGIEREAEYVEIARKRIERLTEQDTTQEELGL